VASALGCSETSSDIASALAFLAGISGERGVAGRQFLTLTISGASFLSRGYTADFFLAFFLKSSPNCGGYRREKSFDDDR
jgi:hypothetical protein